MKKDGVVISLFYSLSANVISLLSNALFLFLLPRFLTEEGYGWYNLYLFYISYVGIFHFGLADGAYLRYGGVFYDKLEKNLVKGQLLLLTVVETVIALAIIAFGLLYAQAGDRLFIVAAAALNCIVFLPRTFLQYVLQATGKIALYAKNYIFERVSFLLLVALLFVVKRYNYRYLVAADVFVKFLTGMFFLYSCRDIFLARTSAWREIFAETAANCKAGVLLLFANISGILIIGFIRLTIERQWDIVTFGKISLSLTICNVFVSFINAVSLVLFPHFKRLPQDALVQHFERLSAVVTAGMFFCLLLYYPFAAFFTKLFPAYGESMLALAVLFPVAVFETRMALLLLTFMKVYRKERVILYINLIIVGVSLCYSVLAYIFSFPVAVHLIAIVALMGLRALVSDFFVKRMLLKIHNADIFYIVGYAVLFILMGRQDNIGLSITFLLLYCVVYIAGHVRKIVGAHIR